MTKSRDKFKLEGNRRHFWRERQIAFLTDINQGGANLYRDEGFDLFLAQIKARADRKPMVNATGSIFDETLWLLIDIDNYTPGWIKIIFFSHHLWESHSETPYTLKEIKIRESNFRFSQFSQLKEMKPWNIFRLLSLTIKTPVINFYTIA